MSCGKHFHVDDVCFSYPGNGAVLDRVHFGIEKGEKVGLIGPNGAGKTTLFLIMCGILKPLSGTVTVNGREVKVGKFNPEITYLFQSPDDQLFSATLYEDVAFGPRNMGLDSEAVRQRVEDALNQVGLSHKTDAVPHHMSGGEKRMGAFASVLSMLPDILLLDEPTSNLDSLNRRNLINVVNSLENTLIIASHDLEFILESCQRVIILNNGKIEADGDAREIMSDRELMETHHMEKPHSLLRHEHTED